ncbi:hypothetical protein [Metabacillus sp. Hm71]|uniref:hypothetical protein n=1 Tax=Metabacillus sp. Hm71 TaxID=3450743 RepID=UPI003F4294A9
MSQMKLNLSVKELDQEVNYINPYKEINLNESFENQTFLIESIEREVKKLPSKKKKVLYTIAKATLTASISSLMLVSPVFAATPTTAIMTTDIMKIGMYLIGICAAVSTILAIILSQLAGAYRMLRKSKEATEWTTDILKGYVQTLLAPVLIITIAFLAYLLFGTSEFSQWFVKPF